MNTQDITQAQITEARDWASDCLGMVAETVTINRALKYISANYPGGWDAFVAECCTEEQPAEPVPAENTTREYRVWCENGDLIDVFDNAVDAEDRATAERAACPCGTDGTDGECGVIHPHGISVQACEGDEDVTQDYLING